MPRAGGVRVLIVARARILLVYHEDPDTGHSWWVLPGGGREPGETLAQAAVREVFEETGLHVRVLRRLRVPPDTPHATYALFLAEPVDADASDLDPTPTVDLAAERYLRAAAWHPIPRDEPIGPLNPGFWSYLAPRLSRLVR